jgi:hypothetical protein
MRLEVAIARNLLGESAFTDLQRTLENLNNSGVLQRLAESVAGAATGWSKAINAAIASVDTNSNITRILVAASHFDAAYRAELSTAAIPLLAKQLSENSSPLLLWSGSALGTSQNAHIETLLGLNAGFSTENLDETTVSLAAQVPCEAFLALDVGVSFSGHDTSVINDSRDIVVSQTTDEVEACLAKYDSALLPMLCGARESARSENVDAIRHVCVSLRELLGHLLRGLAPDAKVKEWAQDPKLLHEGRPTRAARLKYILSDPTFRPLGPFFEADIRATIDLLEGLNQATHVVVSDLRREHLGVVLSKAEGTILVLLKISALRQGSEGV